LIVDRSLIAVNSDDISQKFQAIIFVDFLRRSSILDDASLPRAVLCQKSDMRANLGLSQLQVPASRQ